MDGQELKLVDDMRLKRTVHASAEESKWIRISISIFPNWVIAKSRGNHLVLPTKVESWVIAGVSQ